MNNRDLSKPLVVLFSATLTLVAALVLWPGLYGGFYLDDFVNLGGLSNVHQGKAAVLSYLLDAPVGGSGRPISYLSFLLQAESWPSEPYAFKLVNLAIHFLNGILVTLFVYFLSLMCLGEKENKSVLLALSLFSGFLWVILPINVSTVFYVVQRMTMLSAFMTVVAMLGYVYLRYRFHSWGAREYLFATLFVGFGYFGVFAKESAVLTGLLVFVLEFTLISGHRKKLNSLWSFLILILPLILLFVYLLLSGKILNGYASRDFSLTDRLSTQCVIILDYLWKIVFPTTNSINLYNDDFPIYYFSNVNIKFVFSLIAILAALIFSILFRSKFSWFAFGVLFFLSGHLLESSFIPLELYFEHRNYVPSMGIIITLVFTAGFYLVRLRSKTRSLALVGLVVSGFWAGYLGLVAANESRTWGNPRAFAIAALTERPGSLRARQEMAAYFVGAQDYMGAANLLYSVNDDFGIYSGTYAQLLMLQCYDPRIPLPVDRRLMEIFKTSSFDFGTEVALHDIWLLKRQEPDGCGAVSMQRMTQVLDALLENPTYKAKKNIHVLKALILADEGEYSSAAGVLVSLPINAIAAPELILAARFYYFSGDTDRSLELLERAELSLANPLIKVFYLDYIAQLRQDMTLKQ